MIFLVPLVDHEKNKPSHKMLSSFYVLYCRPRHSLNSLATAVKEIEEIPAYLPNGAVLKDSVQRARDWLQDVEALQVGLKKCPECISASIKSNNYLTTWI